MNSTPASEQPPEPIQPGLWSYVQIARPDHWFKNVFMLLGVVLAWFYRLHGSEGTWEWNLGPVAWGVAAVCLIASSYYTINEILDAPTDRQHPVKRHRPVASGKVDVRLGYAQWLVLGGIGLGMAWMVNGPFFVSAAVLWLMGLVYNVRPARTKDLPYIDVLSESVNNPLRLMLGWFAAEGVGVPPMSLIIAYWMIGAFFMASKRLAEYRSIGHAEAAGAYRKSFVHYDEDKLLISMFFYATASALFLGVFIIRYHVELILSMPLIAGFFAYYLHVTLKPDSPVQHPERLYRQYGLMVYLVLCVTIFVGLMFIRIEPLYDLFNLQGPQVPPLWEF